MRQSPEAHCCCPCSAPRRQVLPGLAPLLEVMGEVAARRRKTLSQVAINWCICQVGVGLVRKLCFPAGS